MEYFLLSSGKYAKQLKSPELAALIPQRMLNKQQAAKLEDTNIIIIRDKDDEPYPDVITGPAWIISDGVKELFAQYDRSITFKALRLVNEGTGKQSLYWIMGLDEIHCLSDRTVFKPAATVYKLVLSEGKIGDKAIFKIGGVQEKYLAVRLDAAESLLRRPLYGLELTRICLEEEEEDSYAACPRS